ncbi:DUF6891 domain-containing protein [Paractinoplanes durhamensis]|uniref:DUF6891 domain-containing protein n=1 Tax=Paractinoplanes durhamensis TaxID=113563 RepID=A0ABQ3YYX3_9ACTN|nr:hypothetical protein [Actinoplanes durhamensis]GIE02793.1 hypothetical protein Adu01nite_41430 [Actinoplanes durhamensis]
MRPEDLRPEATDYLRAEVARGRASCASIVTGTVEYLDDRAEPADLFDLAWELVPAEFAAHLEAQATWPERTDSDRLTAAFRALDESRIVAREDFACCQNCGVTAIRDEVLAGSRARGYVFYHEQDAERAVLGGGLWLAFGPSAQIGEEIVAALRAEGLHVEWDGSPQQRIDVRLRWARRRHGRLAAFPADEAAEKTVPIRFEPAVEHPPMSAAALARLELPWLPTGTTVRVGDGAGAVTIRREGHRLISDDGRVAGRFEGIRLLGGADIGDGGDADGVPTETGLLEVTFSNVPTGAQQHANRPMELPEILDVLRRIPTHTDSWLSAEHDAGCVQIMRKDGRLWLETPNADDSTSTGKFAELDEAERVLTILATEHRNAIPGLEGVTTTPW